MSEQRKKVFIPVVILVVGLSITAVMMKARKPVSTQEPGDAAPFVVTIVAQPEAHRFVVTTHGSVSPRTESALVSEVAGRVISTSPAFASGGFFEEGDIMLRIDPVDYELAVVSAQGLVAQATVRLETERAQAEVAREEWRELGGAESSPLATRELQLAEAEAALATAEAGLRQAKRNLERTSVRSPYACRVRDNIADVGEYVTPGTPVARIYAIDFAEIRLPIPDGDLAFLDLPVDYRGVRSNREGPEVILSAVFAGSRREWEGRIVRVEGEIDTTSRMVNVVARVDNPYGRTDGQPVLPVGLFVEARIMGRSEPRAFRVPRAALRPDGRLMVVDADNRLRFRDVTVLRTGASDAIIGAGLSRGERICISKLDIATDGMRVRTTGAAPKDSAMTGHRASAGGAK